jgi:N-acetylneuraminic acid mutarotase
MWSFDIETETWSPAPVKSTIVPVARSDFAHGKIEENLIMFGGKGDFELLNDLYLFNLSNNEWQHIDIKSIAKPSPRRGACLASTNSISYIYGDCIIWV